MTSTIDPKTIGRPARPRRHVRTLTGKPWVIWPSRTSSHTFFRLLPRERLVGQRTVAIGRRENLERGHDDCPHQCVVCDPIFTRNNWDPDVSEVTKSVIGHVQTSLARQPYNLGMICVLHCDRCSFLQILSALIRRQPCLSEITSS